MASKMVRYKKDEAASLAALADDFARAGASAVEGRLSLFLAEGETMPDVALLAQLAARRVAWQLDALVAADEATLECRAELSEARGVQSEASADLGACLTWLRRVSRSLTKRPAWGRLVPHELPIPQPAQAMLRRAQRYIDRLRHPRAVPFEDLALTADPEALACGLEKKATALRVAVDDFEERSALASLAQVGKSDAMAGFKAEFGPCRRLVLALAELGGGRGLADSLRGIAARGTDHAG